jgi:ABC-type polysaccharide/polyol phosphate export permease
MFNNIILSLKKINVLWYLATLEIKYKYVRSKLGVLWNTLAAFIFILVVSSVYSQVLNSGNDNLFLYSSIGYIFWLLFSSIITESLTLIIDNKNILQDIKINIIDIYIRSVLKNFIIFLHNAIIILFSLFIYSDSLDLVNIFIFLVNFGLILILLFFISISLSFLSLIYRDVIQIVSTLMFLSFLITPIFWFKKFAINVIFVEFNPFYYIINFVRAPLMNQAIPLSHNLIILTMIIISILVALFSYRNNKNIYYLF